MSKVLAVLFCVVMFAAGTYGETTPPAAEKSQPSKIKKTANSDLVFKQRQFELGAEMLPHVAPWINEAAKPCMNSIKKDDKDALAKSAECTAKALETFKSNPSAFINRLPAGERAKLEAMSQDKLKMAPVQSTVTKKEK